MNKENTKKLRILYLSHERKMGGANCSLFELVREMKSRGHSVCVAVMYKGCPIDIKLKEEGIETLPCFYGWWQMPADWNFILKTGFRFLHRMEFLAQRKLCKYVIDHKIDIIHSNSSCIDIGMKVAKATGVKHVWHFREYGEMDYNLIYMHGRNKSISLVKENTDKVIFISKALRNFYNDMDNEDVAQIVYNGISEKFISESKEYNKTPVFLSAGNLNRAKNQLLVLKASKILLDNGVNDFQVKIAGESTSLLESKLYKDELIRFIEENHMENVEMLGFVKDMSKLRKKTDVEIVASVSEAFGRVTAEAMFARNPVIASDAGANPELVEDCETGLIFHNMNVESLAAKMRYLIENREMIPSMGENAFHYAVERYTIGHNADNIENLYYGLCDIN